MGKAPSGEERHAGVDGQVSTKYKKSEDVPNDVLADRMDELVEAITNSTEGNTFPSEFYMRIPAELDRDADLVLTEAARRLRNIETNLADKLNAQGFAKNNDTDNPANVPTIGVRES